MTDDEANQKRIVGFVGPMMEMAEAHGVFCFVVVRYKDMSAIASNMSEEDANKVLREHAADLDPPTSTVLQ